MLHSSAADHSYAIAISRTHLNTTCQFLLQDERFYSLENFRFHFCVIKKLKLSILPYSFFDEVFRALLLNTFAVKREQENVDPT